MKGRSRFLSALPLLAVLVLAGLLFFPAADGDVTVYVTNTGTRYHLENCSSLRRSKTAVTLEAAVRSGYEPCGICRPPELSASSSAARSSAGEGELYRVNKAEFSSSSLAVLSRMVKADVTGHVDGDTVRVRIDRPFAGLKVVETIRMIGVDTPETVHPSRPVERFGKEASDYTKSRLLGKTVYLAFDWDFRDRYGRLLAYIYLDAPEGPRCFNAALIQEGYAHAYTRFAFQFMDEFRALEEDARREKRGLWRSGP
ncbi:MAG: thermonuclease family protein [Treponema sp.]|jgi:micrococcal nuclease|nr:thermonuclease family protein [Treponema sp.]